MTRVCACGCDRSMAQMRRNARFATSDCKRRVYRERRSSRQATTVADGEYADLLKRDPCSYCGCKDDYYREGVGVDHIVPVAEGGDSRWANLTASCSRCNSSKFDHSLLTFLLRGLPV